MSEESPSPPERLSGHRVGPYAELIACALARGHSEHDLAALITDAAFDLNRERTTVHASAVSRWLSGTVARPKMRRWTAHAFQNAGIPISLEQLNAAAKTQRQLSDLRRPPSVLRPGPPIHTPEARAVLTHSANSGQTEPLPYRLAEDPIASLAGVTILGEGEPSERLEYVLKHPSRMDGPTLSHLEQVLVGLETIERHVEAEALIGATLGHLSALTNLLRGTLPSSARRYLCSIAGETAGLAARLYAQLSATSRADSYFRSGLAAAHEADDQALVAYLVGVMAGQLGYRHDPSARLTLLKSCHPEHATPSTQVFLAAKEADAHALLADTNSCLSALERAETVMPLVVTHDQSVERPRAPWWPQETWLIGEQGATLARLGQYRRAAELLDIALARSPNAKHRLWLTAALARVRAGMQEPEEASRTAKDIIASAKLLQMTTVVQEIVYLRRELNPWQDIPAVRELDEALTDYERLPA